MPERSDNLRSSQIPAKRRLLLGLGVAAALIVVVVFGIQFVNKTAQDRSAIIRWRPQIVALIEGYDVYHGEKDPGRAVEGTEGLFPNPPISGVCLYPLARMPVVLSAITWYVLKVTIAALAVIWAVRLGTGKNHHLPLWGLIVVSVLCARPLLSDLMHGNVNIVILFLCLLGLREFTRGHNRGAGLAIGLATAIKVTPALFFPYFLYKRQWQVAAWILAGLIGATFVVPALVLGPIQNAKMWYAWFEVIVKPYAIDGVMSEYTYQINQSIPGLFYRLVTPSPGIVHGDEPAVFINLLSLDRKTASWILKGILVGVVAVLAWACRTSVKDRGDWRLACEFSLVLIAMLLLSERSWKHHYVTMVLPFSSLVAAWAIHAGTQGVRYYLGASAITVFLLMATTSKELFGWAMDGMGHKYAQAYGMFLVAAVVVFVALCIVLHRFRGAAPHHPGMGPEPLAR